MIQHTRRARSTVRANVSEESSLFGQPLCAQRHIGHIIAHVCSFNLSIGGNQAKYFFFQWAYVCSFKFGRMDQHVSWANLMLPRKLSSNTKSWCSNQDQWTHHEIPPESARKRHWHLATRIIQPNRHNAKFRQIKQKKTKIRWDGHNLLYLQYKTKPARSLCKAN